MGKKCIHEYEKQVGDDSLTYCDIDNGCIEGDDVCKDCIYFEGEL